jgi:hypothetical protein
MTNDRQAALIEAWLDATLDDAGLAELETLLLESAEARQDFWERAAIHGLVREAAKMAFAPPVPEDPAATPAGNSPPSRAPAVATVRTSPPWLRRGLWLGAAAVLVGGCGIGSAATSMAIAYSGLLTRTVAPQIVHDEGFEHPPAPAPHYLPTEFDVWGGDETEVVSADRGVVPRSGRKMLRFVSSHPSGMAYEGNASEIWRVLDLDELRRLEGAHELRVEIAAFFNGVVPPGVARAGCLVGAIATDVQPAVLGERWRTLFDAAAVASTRIAIGQRSSVIDDDPATWQRLSASVTVPAEARYLVLYCLASTRPADQAHAGAAEYIDDITVTVSPVEPQAVAAAAAPRTGGSR